MKQVEIGYRSIMTELIKLNERLERAKTRLAKKQAAAEKYGVADMDNEAHAAWLKTVPTQDGWITDKQAIKKNGAWYDLISAQSDVEDYERQIANAEKRMAKAEAKVAEYLAEVERVADLQRKEELQRLEFEQEQKEWKKDGITLEYRYSGYTPGGKRFWVYGNCGMTERSRHCYTLMIDGNVVFTSGEFWRAYGIIKNS